MKGMDRGDGDEQVPFIMNNGRYRESLSDNGSRCAEVAEDGSKRHQ